MNFPRLIVWPLCLLLALASASLTAADDAKPRAPRVGLVLAGGGARGLAHIGVIKYLEENNIRVDAIAGTSMGSIVGGLYASGMSAAEIEQVVSTLDWQKAFNDDAPRNQLTFRRKQEDYDFLARGRLRFKDGRFRIPMGIVEGQNLNLMLHDLVSHVSNITDFDQLPIPYRAVATDIATGDTVVLDHGDLATAMRASMSIPSAFAPVDVDGKLLVDGGIAKNIPVDVVQAMGVDRLIVIDIGTPLSTREQIEDGGGFAIIDQLTTVLTRKNSEQQIALMGPDDILILPALDTAGITTMAFNKAELAIQLGYDAARAAGEQLAVLATPRTRLQLVQTSAPKATKSPLIQRVEIHTDASVSRQLLRNMISQREGKRLDRRKLEEDITAIYGLDEFSRVDYDLTRSDGKNVLNVRAIAHPAGISYLKMGISWEQDSRGDSEFGVRASWRQKGINALGAEWYTLAQLGGRSLFGTEFYQPLDINRRYFLDAQYQYQQRLLNFSEDGEVRARVVVDDHVLEFGPGINFDNTAALRGGLFTGTANTDIQIGSPLLTSSSQDDGGIFAELRYDTLDRAYFPGHGTRLSSHYASGKDEFGAEADYEAWSTIALLARSFGRNSIIATARWSELDIDNSTLILPSQVFSLGGFLSLSGYTRDSLAGNYLAAANLVFYRRLTEQSFLPIDFPVYAGASIETGNVWLRRNDVTADELLYAGSLFIGIDSPLGPVFLGAGFGEHDQRALYLQIGQVFD
ncbi:MAG: patatin-like phospholipase family protein [Gammaproteobacteria bacterium]|nr:patatin-like phospholipase family protein [Gammaproteobacteria bacterium]